MYIAQFTIQNYRGIKALDWKPRPTVNCLLGPGDSAKSTILTAIELALAPAWNVQVDETDCFNLSVINPITITVTIADPPTELLREDAFGLLQRGWSAAQELHDEPSRDDTPALTIRFTVSDDTEPAWHVIADHPPHEKPISAKHRALFGITRTDTIDKHLTWSNGSLLTKATIENDDAKATLARAAKAAREAFRKEEHPKLTSTAETLQKTATSYGVRPTGTYKAALDSKAMQLRAGCLTLHDDAVPARLFGLGTRRILTLALQELTTSRPSITLIDEFEHGLEPHRIRRLLRRSVTTPHGQLFLTTHSPVVIHELAPHALSIVRRHPDRNVILDINDQDLLKTVREVPESLLAQKLLICEGITEVGLMNALDDYWARGGEPMSVRGAIAINGGGSSAAKRAEELKTLGYDVMVFTDSDASLAKEALRLAAKGIPVAMWKGKVATEQRLMQDLPWQGIQDALALALQYRDVQALRDQVRARLQQGHALNIDAPIAQWRDNADLRSAIGSAAKEKAWYKQLHLGEALGTILAAHLASMTTTDTYVVLETIREWLNRD